MTTSRNIVIGVGGGIAAYKACSIIRRYVEDGHHVRVLPTKSALKFVGAATFEALSGHACSAEVFENVPEVPHVRIGQQADLIVVAPATADLLARAANGQADDLLTATLLTARCPVLFAPAMHTEMWEHPATRANVATLRERGAVVVEPASGRLTGADSGPGRLPDPEEVAALGQLLLERPDALPRDLEGVRVLVTAGGTREPLDPVRFLGNRSSGKQGYAVARLAAQRGAHVTLVAGTTSGLADPAAVRVVRATTAQQMGQAVVELAGRADLVVMAAAVADFRAKDVSPTKIKKTGSEPEPVVLERNDDILASLVAARQRGELPADVTIVGFAAETGDDRGDVLFHARRKLASKGCDLLVVNAVTEGNAFEVDENAGWILAADGAERSLAKGSKAVIASRVLDAASAAREQQQVD